MESHRRLGRFLHTHLSLSSKSRHAISRSNRTPQSISNLISHLFQHIHVRLHRLHTSISKSKNHQRLQKQRLVIRRKNPISRRHPAPKHMHETHQPTRLAHPHHSHYILAISCSQRYLQHSSLFRNKSILLIHSSNTNKRPNQSNLA